MNPLTALSLLILLFSIVTIDFDYLHFKSHELNVVGIVVALLILVVSRMGQSKKVGNKTDSE